LREQRANVIQWPPPQPKSTYAKKLEPRPESQIQAASVGGRASPPFPGCLRVAGELPDARRHETTRGLLGRFL